jgi:hypothetical protein
MKRLGCLAIAALLLGASTIALEARAADPVDRVYTEAEKQEAQARFDEGVKLYQQHRIDEARVKFTQAYAVLKKPNMLWNQAVAEFWTGMYVEAARHFREHEALPGAEPANVQLGRTKYIPDAEQKVGRVRVSAPAGARVLVDGELQPGAAPFTDPLYVAPGKHTIGVKGSDKPSELTVTAGNLISVTLEAPPGTPAGPIGNDPPPGSTPPASRTEQPTTYVYKSGRVPVTIGLGVVAIAGIAGGVVFAMDSQSKADDVNAARNSLPEGACTNNGADPRCVDLREKIDGVSSSNTLSTVFYVVGGVAAAGAVAAWFLWPKKPAPSTARSWVLPTASPAGLGVNVVGSF